MEILADPITGLEAAISGVNCAWPKVYEVWSERSWSVGEVWVIENVEHLAASFEVEALTELKSLDLREIQLHEIRSVFKHRHEFFAETRNGESGTIVRDVMEYDPGFGMLGHLAQKLFIALGLKQTFEYRQRMLEKPLS